MTLYGSQAIIQGNSKSEENLLEPNDIARVAIDVASEKQAEDIVMLDLRGLVSFTDYFVIMSADSQRQLKALQEDLIDALKGAGASLHHSEGTLQGGWMLLDFSDVIIHIFGSEQREYYRLDQLWASAPQVVRVL